MLISVQYQAFKSYSGLLAESERKNAELLAESERKNAELLAEKRKNAENERKLAEIERKFAENSSRYTCKIFFVVPTIISLSISFILLLSLAPLWSERLLAYFWSWWSAPRRFHLTVEVSKTYRCASTPNDCPEPIGLQDTIAEAMDIISSHIDKSTCSSGTYRKPPILISRLARGGKTTALLALFDRLKDDGNNVMFISFNNSSNFMRLEEESEEEAFYRVIAAQLVDSNGYEGKVVPDWETLDRHIGVRPFVLLVDEINALSFPVSGKLSIILKKYFLDKANRFLVISSHFPVDLELEFNRESAGSLRSCEVLSLPTCTKIKLIRKMSDKCSHISVPTVAYYGGFPSLLYSRFQNEDFDPDQWFLRSKFAAVKSKNSFLPDFVDELLEGKLMLTHADIRGFDKLASLRTIYVGGRKEQRIHWPLCYIHCILEQVVGPAAKEIVSLICNFQFAISPGAFRCWSLVGKDCEDRIFASICSIGKLWKCWTFRAMC